MSTPFYDLASMVVLPSGYKSGKIYAQKPLTTDGQLSFTRASNATRVNASGLIETVSSGVPRLDYLNSTCPRLLLEPQRTNVAQYSEQFNNAYWDKFNITISANSATAPDGTTSADKIIADANNSNHAIYKQTLISSGSATISVYAKAAGYNFIFLSDTLDLTKGAYFNLSNGTLGTIGANATASIQNAGNGWYRCVLTVTAASGTGIGIDLASANGTLSFAGNNVNGVFVWGAQVEAGAYATSYIPTLGTSVTRLADVATKTGISSLIGQTEGTLFAEFTNNASDSTGFNNRILAISDGTSSNRINIMRLDNSQQLFLLSVNGGVTQFNTGGISGTNLLGTHKVALAYKNNDYVCYLDGVQVFTTSSASVPAASQFFIGSNESGGTDPLCGSISQALLFKTRLTNAQLAELTTL